MHVKCAVRKSRAYWLRVCLCMYENREIKKAKKKEKEKERGAGGKEIYGGG